MHAKQTSDRHCMHTPVQVVVYRKSIDSSKCTQRCTLSSLQIQRIYGTITVVQVSQQVQVNYFAILIVCNLYTEDNICHLNKVI